MEFNRIRGQNQVLDILKKITRNHSIAHAYLFFGPPSVGKMLTALIWAKALNCIDRGPLDACGKCLSCRKIDQGVHPDYFLVEPTKSSPTAKEAFIRIETIRELQKKLMFRPYEGNTKIAIIDQVEQMNMQAANSFLKTLEEPPKSTLIILISSNPYRLLSTMVSRCQAIKFSPLTANHVKQILSQQEDIEPKEIEMRSIRSRGNLEKAMEQNLLENSQIRHELIELIEEISFNRMDLAFRWSKTWAKKTDQLHSLLDELSGLIRDLALLNGNCLPSEILNQDLLSVLKPVALKKKLASFLKMFQTVQETKRDLQGNFNTQLTLEMMFIKFSESEVQ